jgi:hypothetical protein
MKKGGSSVDNCAQSSESIVRGKEPTFEFFKLLTFKKLPACSGLSYILDAVKREK